MSHRILIVEDNPWNARLIGDILESLNKYTLLEAVNGMQALEMVREAAPDLILLDVMLPDKNGIEVIRELKGNTTSQHIPIIALTASASLDLQRLCLEAGCNKFMTKPFTKKVLLDAITGLLPD